MGRILIVPAGRTDDDILKNISTHHEETFHCSLDGGPVTPVKHSIRWIVSVIRGVNSPVATIDYER